MGVVSVLVWVIECCWCWWDDDSCSGALVRRPPVPYSKPWLSLVLCCRQVERMRREFEAAKNNGSSSRAYESPPFTPPRGGRREPTLYEILGVSRYASSDAINKAFRAKARIHHPGECPRPSGFLE